MENGANYYVITLVIFVPKLSRCIRERDECHGGRVVSLNDMSEMLACLIQVLGDNYDIHSDHINAQTEQTVTHRETYTTEIFTMFP